MKTVRSVFLSAICALGLLAGVSASAYAATCPAGAGASDPRIVLLTGPAATCVGTGDGTVDNPGGDEIVTIQGAGPSTTTTSGPLTVTIDADKTGSFSLSATIWDLFSSLWLTIKDGNLADGFQWGTFSLVSGVLTGDWEIWGKKGTQAKDLSHMTLWGVERPGGSGEVPLPGALFLFGTVLAGSYGFARWKKERRKGQVAAA